MKKIFTADLHIQDYDKDNKTIEDGSSLKLNELLNNFSQLCDYAINNNIIDIYIGGDINNNKHLIHANSFAKFKKLLNKYNDLKFIIYLGNHDINYSASEDFAIDLLESENVEIIKDTVIRNNMTIIPFSDNLLDEIKKSPPNDILLSHFPLAEGATDNGMNINSKFRKKDLKKFKLVLIGDYHTHQNVDNIWYPGSLIPVTKSEIDDKGFIVFDDETLQIDFIKVDGYRRYKNIVIDESSNIDDIKDLIKEYKQKDYFVTVRKHVYEIPTELKEDISECCVVDNYEKEYKFRGITSSMNIEEQMKKYLEIENVPEKDMEQYLKIGMEIANYGNSKTDDVK